ncbi:actin-related protein 2/3 complex subunit 1B-like [Dorcoceras hygrometricum]|uniref:Actin-related protein 2/3 complex subunit 1B-like n=1 Tax=Dorcoceras hygrometricum TaxID=472368 RepID=A0A2Z7C987_9LAMI|nr:actin-related protein 2/3 complex subunit 1B-like [Dorcoceras hygrometricum]
MVAPSNATAEISSQHSKMLTNTFHSFVDPCISTPAASSNHSKRNYCQQITMRHDYVISTDSKFTILELHDQVIIHRKRLGLEGHLNLSTRDLSGLK